MVGDSQIEVIQVLTIAEDWPKQLPAGTVSSRGDAGDAGHRYTERSNVPKASRL